MKHHEKSAGNQENGNGERFPRYHFDTGEVENQTNRPKQCRVDDADDGEGEGDAANWRWIAHHLPEHHSKHGVAGTGKCRQDDARERFRAVDAIHVGKQCDAGVDQNNSDNLRQ